MTDLPIPADWDYSQPWNEELMIDNYPKWYRLYICGNDCCAIKCGNTGGIRCDGLDRS